MLAMEIVFVPGTCETLVGQWANSAVPAALLTWHMGKAILLSKMVEHLSISDLYHMLSGEQFININLQYQTPILRIYIYITNKIHI